MDLVLGSEERPGVGIVAGDEAVDVGDQLGNAVERASAATIINRGSVDGTASFGVDFLAGGTRDNSGIAARIQGSGVTAGDRP